MYYSILRERKTEIKRWSVFCTTVFLQCLHRGHYTYTVYWKFSILYQRITGSQHILFRVKIFFWYVSYASLSSALQGGMPLTRVQFECVLLSNMQVNYISRMGSVCSNGCIVCCLCYIAFIYCEDAVMEKLLREAL